MRSLLVVAMLLGTSAAVRAESFSFVIGGQAIHIGIGAGCSDVSCISVDVPGYYGHGGSRRSSRHAAQQRNAKPAKVKPAAPVAAPSQDIAATEPSPGKAAMVQDAAPATQTRSVTPAAAAPVESTPLPVAVAPALEPEPKASTERAPLDSAEPTENAAPAVSAPAAVAKVEPDKTEPANTEPTKTEPSLVIAALPPAKDDTERAKPAPAMPTGIWSSSEGQLRIEACGQFLCGYAAGGRHAGQMVLINMRPTKNNSWAGRVHDFKSGGTYSARMTLRGPNSLRVEGCAFGGMICDGRTLARVN